MLWAGYFLPYKSSPVGSPTFFVIFSEVLDNKKPRKNGGLNGEPCAIRTRDLLIKSQLLYQLS